MEVTHAREETKKMHKMYNDCKIRMADLEARVSMTMLAVEDLLDSDTLAPLCRGVGWAVYSFWFPHLPYSVTDCRKMLRDSKKEKTKTSKQTNINNNNNNKHTHKTNKQTDKQKTQRNKTQKQTTTKLSRSL